MSAGAEREVLASLRLDRVSAGRARGRWSCGAVGLLVSLAVVAATVARAPERPNDGEGFAHRAGAPTTAFARRARQPSGVARLAPAPPAAGLDRAGHTVDSARTSPPLHTPFGSAPEPLVHAAGYVVARRRAVVSAPVPGRLAERWVALGDVVAAGDLLARIEDETVRARWQLAVAETRAARSALGETEVRIAEARRVWERRARLLAGGAASEEAESRARSELDAGLARLAHRRDQLVVAARRAEYWERELLRHTVRAPFAGVVASVDAEVGEAVAPVPESARFARVGLLTLVDLDTLQVEVDVSESQIAGVRVGAAAQIAVDAHDDLPLPGRVAAITPVADRRRGTLRVQVVFDRIDERLRPEMGVRVSLRTTTTPEPARRAGGAGGARE